jgi:hypothetical protein
LTHCTQTVGACDGSRLPAAAFVDVELVEVLGDAVAAEWLEPALQAAALD